MGTPMRAFVVAAVHFAAARYMIALHDLAGLGALFWPGNRGDATPTVARNGFSCAVAWTSVSESSPASGP